MAANELALDVMAFLDVPGIGVSRVRKLLTRWRSGPEAPLLDSPIVHDSLTPDQLAVLPTSRTKLERLMDDGDIHPILILDAAYPDALKEALGESAPILLLCRGNLDLLRKLSVGFCGSRRASDMGITTAWKSADLLARRGVNVVAGYAAGVDMNAHRAALAAGGTTTVVLAEGILRFRVKKEIGEDWDNRRTLVVGEFGLNLPWSVGNAMQRNQTICGLSQAMIVIEAGITGGSIQAGRDCLRLGLPLFAAAYEGMSDIAPGNQQLLAAGARPLMRSRSQDWPNIDPVVAAMYTSGGHAASATQMSLL